MTNDLTSPADLAHLPGAPFDDAEVDAAVAAVRAAAGWHIAPVKVETIALDVQCFERWLRLPTLALVSVDAIRDTTDQATPVAIETTAYRKSSNLNQVISTANWWPDGYEAVEVDMSHGYTSTPTDLLQVIAEAATITRSGGTIGTSIKLGDLSISGSTATNTDEDPPLENAAILDRYTLPKLGFA